MSLAIDATYVLLSQPIVLRQHKTSLRAQSSFKILPPLRHMKSVLKGERHTV